MGCWNRVQVNGSCSPEDVSALHDMLAMDKDGWGPLCNGGVCGLPNFANTAFDVVGNLAERDFTPDEVAEHLQALRDAAPSLRCVIHFGEDYEEDECIATIVCDDDGIRVEEPHIAEVPDLDEDTMRANLIMSQLRGLP